MNAVENYLHEECGASFPGYGFAVFQGGGAAWSGFGGAASVEPGYRPVTRDTLFDLASLTKPLCTGLLALKLAEAGRLDLFEPLEAGESPAPSLLDLLRHEGGFPDWIPLYAVALSKDQSRTWLAGKCPRRAPQVEAVYSDLGYILAGFILEERIKRPLDELFYSWVAEPLGCGRGDAMFRPGPGDTGRAAATEVGVWKESAMAARHGAEIPPFPGGRACGVVNDGNARFLGGVAGHAGLFATVQGAVRLARGYFPSSGFLTPESLELAWTHGCARKGESRSSAFKLADSPGWAPGAALGSNGAGHDGYTGTGVYLEKKAERGYILLTNRIHPQHPGTDFGPVRTRFIGLAISECDTVDPRSDVRPWHD